MWALRDTDQENTYVYIYTHFEYMMTETDRIDRRKKEKKKKEKRLTTKDRFSGVGLIIRMRTRSFDL